MSNQFAANAQDAKVRGLSNTNNSIQARIVERALRLTMRPLMSPKVPLGVQRFATNLLRFSPRPGNVSLESYAVPGFVGEKHTPDHLFNSRYAILYFHGGGYVMGSPASHRNLGARIASAAQLPVYMPSYRLAPEHSYPCQLEDAERAFLALMGQGYKPEHILIGGDSAGGNLTLALALQLRETGVGMPAGLILISPWTDATFDQVPSPNNDALLPLDWAADSRPRFASDAQITDPKVSPVLADYKDFPPTLVQSASVELLANDAARLVECMKNAGVRVEWQEDQGLWHDYQLNAGTVPEATDAVRRIGVFAKAVCEG